MPELFNLTNKGTALPITQNEDSFPVIDSNCRGINVESTTSISLSGNGSTCEPLYATVNISSTSGNTLSILSNGLYASGGTGSISFDTFTTGFTYSNNTFSIKDNSGHTFNALINTVTGLTVTGSLSAVTISATSLNISAATNPVRIQGLSATTADTKVLSVDSNGVLHSMPLSSLSGATAFNNFNVFLTGNHSNDVLLPHATIAVKDKFYVGSALGVAGFGNIICYNDPNDLTNKTTIIPFSANVISFFAMCYSSVNDRIYTIGTVATGSSHYVLVTINPNTNTYSTQTLTGVTIGNNDINQYGMDTDDTNVYVGASDNRLFRFNLSNLVLTTLVLTGGNIIHDVRYIKYSDGAEIIATSSSSFFPIYSVDPATFTVSSSLSTAPLWTDDMALMKNAGNTVAAGCSFWLGAELNGHCIKYQSTNRVISATTEEVTNSLPSYGLFTDGTLVYSVSRLSSIEVWPFNLTSAQPIVNGIVYLIGNENVFGVPSWAPNEILVSNSGKMFFTNYSTAGAPTDSGIYEFRLSPAPIGNPLNTSVTGVTLTNNVLSVTKNNFTATTTINAVTGGSYSNGTITLQGSGVLGSITGLTTGSTSSSNTIYSADDKLQGNRTINLSSFTLNFSSVTAPNQFLLSGGSAFVSGQTTFNYSGNDTIKLIGSGSGASRSGLYIQNTNTTGRSCLFMENDRGSFLSYGGMEVGGSASSLSLFGLTIPDRVYVIADGTNNQGMAIGTLQNQPLSFGTNNAVKMTINGNGNVGIGKVSTGAFIDILFNDAVNNGINSQNINTAGQSAFQALNSSGQVMGTRIKGSAGGSLNSFYGAFGMLLYGNAPGHMGIVLDNVSGGDIYFDTQGLGNTKMMIKAGGNVLIGTTADTGTGILQISGGAINAIVNNIGSITSAASSGLTLINSISATTALTQSSPAITLQGSGWKTTSTATSQTVAYREFVLPIQGTTTPTAQWKLQSNINNAGFTDVLSVRNDGQLKIGNFVQGTPANTSALITTGDIRLGGVLNFRSPLNGDDIFTGIGVGGLGMAFSVGNASGMFSIGQLAGGSATGIGTLASSPVFTNPPSGSTGEVAIFNSQLSVLHTVANTVNYSAINIQTSIGQGAFGSGATRGIFINPALPSAFDFRAIDIVVGGKIVLGSTTGTSVGIGVSAQNITNIFHVSGATNPVRIQGLSSTTIDSSVVSVDTSGVLHSTAISNLFPNGQVTLSAGTKTITVNNVLSTSKGFPALAVASGFTNTIEYLVSCSTNTVLIKALNASGGTNTADVSTINYFVII